MKTRSRLGLISSLLEPIQQIIADLLEEEFREGFNKNARKALADLADADLVRLFPLTRVIPPKTRQRIISAQLDVTLDQIVLNNELPEADAGTGFEGFILRTQKGNAEIPSQLAARAVLNVLGSGWTIHPLPLDAQSFHVSSDEFILSVPEAWEATHDMKQQPDIAQVEPDFIVPMESNIPDKGPGLAITALGERHLPATNDREWSIKAIKVRDAWALAPPQGGKAKGDGIIVGHPDTGYTHHPENWSDDPAKNKILHRFGYDFWKEDADASDDLDSGIFCGIQAGFACIPGHGTGTSSVIFSDEGSPNNNADFVTGVAPRVRLIPFRVAPTVVVWNQRRLADAILRAADTGCHVVSISMGGAPSFYLHSALQNAAARGVIVCCAAGNVFGASNITPVVVWPAAYDEAIAVAASNADNKPWNGSSRGNQVDITAPGESVWRAFANQSEELGGVDRGSGTSFAVAHVAGVAALWLAFHGRDELIVRYGEDRIASVFRSILVSSGFNRPAGWNTGLFGNGIIDAQKVLTAALPPASFSARAALREQTPFDQLANLFDDVPRSALRRELSALLNTREPLLSNRLEEIGDELTFHFFSDAKAREEFRKRCKAAPAPAAARAARTPAAARTRRAGPDRALVSMASSRLAACITKYRAQ